MRPEGVSPTTADLYDPDVMLANLRTTHCRDDEVLERMSTARRSRNHTERLGKLFEMSTTMTPGRKKTQQKKAPR